jgi:hypothetical protein
MSTLPFLPPVDDLQRTYEVERTRFLAGEVVCTPCLGRRLLCSSRIAVASWRAIAVEVGPPAWTGDPAENRQRLSRIVAQLLGDAEVGPSSDQGSVVTCA